MYGHENEVTVAFILVCSGSTQPSELKYQSGSDGKGEDYQFNLSPAEYGRGLGVFEPCTEIRSVCQSKLNLYWPMWKELIPNLSSDTGRDIQIGASFQNV